MYMYTYDAGDGLFAFTYMMSVKEHLTLDELLAQGVKNIHESISIPLCRHISLPAMKVGQNLNLVAKS